MQGGECVNGTSCRVKDVSRAIPEGIGSRAASSRVSSRRRPLTAAAQIQTASQADSLLVALGEPAPPDTAVWYHPRFHLKTQFFGSAEGLREVLGRPEWRGFFERRIRERLHELPGGTDIRLDHLSGSHQYLSDRPPETRDRQVLYLEVGSHNQDPRSYMLDGEELCIVSGEGALIAAGDMLLLSTAGVTWLNGGGDLELHLPAKGSGFIEAARASEAIF